MELDATFLDSFTTYMVDSELHAAAAEGDIKRCATLLAGDSPPLPNAPDSEGRSAIFYAQVRGHAGVAKLLSTNGWTPMPEHNLWLVRPNRDHRMFNVLRLRCSRDDLSPEQ